MTEDRPTRPLSLIVTSWMLQTVGAAVFLLVGVGKLLAWPDHVATFSEIGVGQWLRYAVGAAEVAGGVLLLVPRTAGLAALGLAAVVAGAVLTHVFVLMDQGWVLPLALTAAMAAVAWIRRPETARLIGRGTVL
ncbi:DoxX family protein [Nocardiopsis kunsanensis]|uniref:DoxX family protein n=1 Tax=Nocardiopsis kunsanensis TaxID=141693 RepID=UPI00034DED5D|nr:DoxX family protein [Nocardiopsis kunsanensis]